MSLLTAAKQKNPDLGYAPDFVAHAVGPHLQDIQRKGVKIIANAGGINTSACVAALTAACKKAGVEGMKIAQVVLLCSTYLATNQFRSKSRQIAVSRKKAF